MRFSIHLPSKVDRYQRYHFLSLLISGQTLCGNPDYFGSVKQEEEEEEKIEERGREESETCVTVTAEKTVGPALLRGISRQDRLI